MENNENKDVTTSADVTPAAQGTTVDFEQECKKQALEIEKLKNAISRTNAENAEYKRKELDKMTDDEKKAKEYQDLVARSEQMAAELKMMKLEKEALENGFSKDETEKLIKGNFSLKDIAEIMNARITENTKSVTAGLMKQTTPTEPIGNTTTGGQKSNDFVAFQKKKEEKEVTGRVEL